MSNTPEFTSPVDTYKTGNRTFSLVPVKHPSGIQRPHYGDDIPATRGTPIHASESGKISFNVQKDKSTGEMTGYGKWISINHGEGYETRYAHLDKFNSTIKSGQYVEKGDIIGYVGNTGGSFGNHLHFEIREWDNNKKQYVAKNPQDFVDNHAAQQTPTKTETGKIGSYTYPFFDDKDQKFVSNLDEHANNENGGLSLKTQIDLISKHPSTKFLTELNAQLPSMLPMVIARLAMGEDIKVISADMATRLLATSAINTYAENHWAASGGRDSLQANTADAIAQYATTIIITNVFSGGMSKEEYVRAAANISIQTITTELIKYTEVTAAQQLATQAAYNKAISYGASESAAKLAGSEAASAIKTVPLSPRASGTAAAIAYIGMKIAKDGLPKNQEEVEDMAANAASAFTIAYIGASIGTAIFPGIGTAAGFAIGLVIGIVAGQPLTNAYNSVIDDTKEAIDGAWNAGGKILHGDIVNGVGDLVKSNAMFMVHSIQVVGHFIADVGDAIKLLTFGNEAPPPPPLFKIEQKSDGTGQIVYSLHDGRTIVVGNGNDDIVGTNAGETLAGGDGNNTLYALGGDDFLDGRGGNDVLIAGDGNDNVSSGAGDDFIDGGSGNDTIQGQAGNDTIAGGAGGRHHLR